MSRDNTQKENHLKTFNVLYVKPDHTRNILGWSLDSARAISPETVALMEEDVLNTHTPLVQVEAEDINDVFGRMQGEVWSSGPNQEWAQGLIKKLGLSHTSMSMGDILIDDESGQAYYCDTVGYVALDIPCDNYRNLFETDYNVHPESGSTWEVA